MDLEKFKKVLSLHIKIVEKTTKRNVKILDSGEGVSTTEEENERLWHLIYFLYDKLHDIKIDSIRHGILKEDDFKFEEVFEGESS